MADVPGTNSRAKTFMLNSAATTNATSVKASPGFVFSVVANTVQTAATRYVKFFDKASAPTVGTDRPVFQVTIPAASATAATADSGYARLAIPEGIRFSNGIAIAVCGLATDLDNTSVAANDIKVVITYK